MYTFFNITPENLEFEIEAEIACIVSDENRRIKMIREGIVYQPNYATMEHLCNYYYRGQPLTEQPTKCFTFIAVREQEDYVTDVNGKKVLKDRSYSIGTLGDYPLITIEMLSFIGTATMLLQKHGMLYFHKGQNALDIEKELTRRARLKLDLGV